MTQETRDAMWRVVGRWAPETYGELILCIAQLRDAGYDGATIGRYLMGGHYPASLVESAMRE